MTFSIVLVTACFTVAVAGLLPSSPVSVRHRLTGPSTSTFTKPRGFGWPVAIAVAVVVSVGVWAVAGSGAGAITVCIVLITVTGVRVARSARRERQRRHRRASVAEASDVLSGMLRLGYVPTAALEWAAHECDALRDAADAQAVGGNVAPTLRKAASTPGYEDLTHIAAGWEIATVTGAELAPTMDTVSTRLRNDQRVSEVVRAELSAPRATGRLLAGLPVVGLVLGIVVGADPVRFLTHDVVGQICLIGGVSLMCIGLWWTDHIADQAGELS